MFSTTLGNHHYPLHFPPSVHRSLLKDLSVSPCPHCASHANKTQPTSSKQPLLSSRPSAAILPQAEVNIATVLHTTTAAMSTHFTITFPLPFAFIHCHSITQKLLPLPHVPLSQLPHCPLRAATSSMTTTPAAAPALTSTSQPSSSTGTALFAVTIYSFSPPHCGLQLMHETLTHHHCAQTRSLHHRRQQMTMLTATTRTRNSSLYAPRHNTRVVHPFIYSSLSGSGT
jgi:hypothetical protein